MVSNIQSLVDHSLISFFDPFHQKNDRREKENVRSIDKWLSTFNVRRLVTKREVITYYNNKDNSTTTTSTTSNNNDINININKEIIIIIVIIRFAAGQRSLYHASRWVFVKS